MSIHQENLGKRKLGIKSAIELMSPLGALGVECSTSNEREEFSCLMSFVECTERQM